MANREALRELQTRLAARLQAARVEGSSVSSWLAVESAGRRFLLPLGQSGEIFPWTGVQPVPYTQGWFLGVANLRGSLIGVVDLAGLRDAIAEQGGDPAAVNPVVPVQLIVDHSLAVECGGSDPDAFRKNREIEDRRNEDRFHFIEWTKKAFSNVEVIPAATGSCTRSIWRGCPRWSACRRMGKGGWPSPTPVSAPTATRP